MPHAREHKYLIGAVCAYRVIVTEGIESVAVSQFRGCILRRARWWPS